MSNPTCLFVKETCATLELRVEYEYAANGGHPPNRTVNSGPPFGSVVLKKIIAK